MPIRGLTDNVRPAFPRLGKLRKGDEKPAQGNRPGQELPYWRFTSETPDIEQAFVKAYGEECTSLEVALPFPAIDDNWQAWQEDWVAGGLSHRCDGAICSIWLREDGTYSHEPKPCPGGCKPVGRLNVALKGLFHAGWVGYVTMETHSINDIINIQASLEAVVMARGSNDLTGIEFDLRRVQRSISTPGSNGKRVRRDKWMVELSPGKQWALHQLERSRAKALLGLTAGYDDMLVDPQTGEIVDSDGDWSDADDDVIEGEIVKDEPPKQTPQGNGTDARPGSVENVQSWLKTSVAQRIRKGSATDNAIDSNLTGAVAGRIAALFPHDADTVILGQKRHALLYGLFGKKSTKELTDAEGRALLAWSAMQGDDGEWQVNPDAIIEADRVVISVEEAAGQKKLM